MHEMMDTSSDSTQPQKFSRYRSVRRAAVRSDDCPPPVPETPAMHSQLNRQPSRYRRPTVSRSHDVPLPNAQVNQTLPQTTRNIAVSSPSRTQQSRNVVKQNGSPPLASETLKRQETRDHGTLNPEKSSQKPGARTNDSRPRGHTTPASSELSGAAMTISSEAAREEARLILEGEYDRLEKVRAQRRQQKEQLKRAATAPATQPSPQAKASIESHRAPALADTQSYNFGKGNGPPQLKRQVQPQQKSDQKLEQKFVDVPQLSKAERPVQSQQKQEHKFVDVPQLSKIERQIQPQLKQEQKFVDAPQLQKIVRQMSVREKPPPPSQAPLKSGLRSPEPKSVGPLQKAFDAPVSAVNAGERRVQIKCEDAVITLPVTPTTTVRDLLNSASVCLSQPIDPRTAVLLENFAQLGLERPLRRYERVRDVMNSWDTDSQNHLLIVPASDCDANGLEQKDAPSGEPGHVMLQMHHSQRPGRWDKHWVILRSDGQVTASKRENDGNAPNIFHVSDYDVYMPTKQQAKRLKPPKKICFAVKSQQKSSMFLEGANYVHFFATNDRSVADTWYNAIQSWRSWYLVDILGEGRPARTLVAETDKNHLQSIRPETAHSRDSIPYQLGSFQPLLDFSIGDVGAAVAARISEDRGATSPKFKPLIDFASNRLSFDNNSPSPARPTHQRDAPPTSFQSRYLSELADSAPGKTEQAFTGKGLLGRSKSVKRSQGGDNFGHGVSGSKGKTLIDLGPTSEFADGSLLRKLERMSHNEPRIDRSKDGEGVG